MERATEDLANRLGSSVINWRSSEHLLDDQWKRTTAVILFTFAGIRNICSNSNATKAASTWVLNLGVYSRFLTGFLVCMEMSSDKVDKTLDILVSKVTIIAAIGFDEIR